MFREQYDEKLQAKEQMSKFSPPINKVGKLLRPSIIPIIGQPKSLDLLKIMNTNKIVICRLSKGRIGEEISQLLGSLMVSMISIAALKREKQKKRSPFLLINDEAQNFAHGGRFSTILAEGRKYGLASLSAFQGMHQVPFARDIFSNAQNQIVFNVSGEDAQATADNWQYFEYPEKLTASNITSLPRYTFYCRTFIGDTPTVELIKSSAPDTKQMKDKDRKILIDKSLERWATDKNTVKKKMRAFLSSE